MYMYYWGKILDIHNIPKIKGYHEILNNIDFELINNSDLSRTNPIPVYTGGGKIAYIHDNEEYNFFKSEDKYNIIYSIKELNNDELMDCLLLVIEKDAHIAYIQNLSNYEKCVNDNRKINGSDLLNVGISFIKYMKNKYKLKKIRLKDTSNKICKVGQKFELSRFYTLLFGHTWYGIRGFRPFCINLNPKSNLNKEYENNLIKNKNIRIKDIPKLKSYLLDFYENCNNSDKIKYETIITSYLQIIKNNPNENLGKFLRNLMLDYKNNCAILFSFYKKIYKDANYADFYMCNFELNI